MKKKKIVQIVTLALAVTTIATTAFATSFKGEGYDLFKKSLKSMRTIDSMTNGTMNINFEVEDNGVNIAKVKGKVKADHEERKMSGAFTVGVKDTTKDIEMFANDKEKVIVDLTNDEYYKFIGSNDFGSDRRQHGEMKGKIKGEMTEQEEALVDYFIGDFKEKFQLIDAENGNKVISFNLKEDEIPVPVNLMISAAASREHVNEDFRAERGMKFEGLTLFDELNENTMPNLIEDVKVKEFEFSISLNENDEMVANSFLIKIEGKDEDGINHNLVVKGTVEFEGINESVVDTIDLTDKEVIVVECQSNK